RPRPVAQNLGQRIGKSSWLRELQNISLSHGVSLLCWRSGGVEHLHDTPPYPFTPSPTFAHSSAEVHTIVAGAQLAQGKPEMARNRFGFLERHIRSVLRTAARYECVPLTFDAGVVSLQLMKGLAMSRTINHMNPPATVPHVAGAGT